MGTGGRGLSLAVKRPPIRLHGEVLS